MSVLLATATLIGMIARGDRAIGDQPGHPRLGELHRRDSADPVSQAVMAAFVFSFAILGARHGTTFLPRRDYSFFIGSIWTLHGPGQSRRRCRFRSWRARLSSRGDNDTSH